MIALAGCRSDADSKRLSQLDPPYSLGSAELPKLSYKMCAQEAPAPVKDLILGSVYKKSDPTRSEIDEDAKKIYQQQIRELSSYENKLSVHANNYLKSEKTDGKAASCALDWLYDWAKGNALLGETNVQGGYARQWALSTLSSSYLQVKDFPSFEKEKKKIIEEWLSEIAGRVSDEYADIQSEVRRQNNHLYWGAWAVTATGLATDRRDLYEWGVNKVKYALHVQAQKDGTLPLELIRGKKALQYHVFALAPLVMVAETAMQNGEDLYALNDGMLHKIVDRTFSGLSDPSYFEKLTEHQQIPTRSMSSGHFSWIETYNARFPNEKMEHFLAERRPIISRRTGGDMSFLYAKERLF